MAKTLFEDWVERRRYFESLGVVDYHNNVQIKVLDFLLSRYRDSAVANQPARFSLQQNLHWNNRLITVHHHLGRGKVAGVQNHKDAARRVAELVHRMTAGEGSFDEGFTPTNEDSRSESEKPVCESSNDEGFTKTKVAITPRSIFAMLKSNFESIFMPTKVANKPQVIPADIVLDWRISRGWNADSLLRSILAKSPLLSEVCLEHLISRLIVVTRDDTSALDLFLKCRNSNIIECTVRVWLERVAQGKATGLITEKLEARLQHPDNQLQAVELIRLKLANDEPRIRVAATRLMGLIGNLDDIGLLSDLLALPPADDEDAQERDVISAAMNTIAERFVAMIEAQ